MGRREIQGESARRYQQQQQNAKMQEAFLMQSMLIGIVQQLERIEQMVEGRFRPGALRRSEESGLNHVTIADNFAALQTKLTAFNQVNILHRGKFSPSCLNIINAWICRQSQVMDTPLMARALAWTLDACIGNYYSEVEPVHLDERTLQNLGARLAFANHQWHKKEVEFHRNPEGYLANQELHVDAETEYLDFDFDELRRKLEAIAQNPGCTNDEQRGGNNPAEDDAGSTLPSEGKSRKELIREKLEKEAAAAEAEAAAKVFKK